MLRFVCPAADFFQTLQLVAACSISVWAAASPTVSSRTIPFERAQEH